MALAKCYIPRQWDKKSENESVENREKNYEGIGSRFGQITKSKNEIKSFLISSRSGKTGISKYSVLGSF